MAEITEFDEWHLACTQLAPTADRMTAWRLFQQGLAFVRRSVPPAQPGTAAQQALSVLLTHQLLPGIDDDQQQTLDHLDALVHQLEIQYPSEATEAVSADALLGLRAQLDLLEPLLLAVQQSAWHPLSAVLAHIDEIEHRCRRANPSLCQRIAELRLSTLRQQSQQLLTLLQTPATREATTDDWSFYHEAMTLLFDRHRCSAALGRLPDELHDLTQTANELRQILTSTAADQLRNTDSAQRPNWLHRTDSELHDHLTDILSESEDWPRTSRVFALASLRADVATCLQTMADHGLPKPTRLTRIYRYLHTTWVEQTVLLRLESRFSSRSIRRLDRFVLVAIMGVLGLLLIEWTVALPPIWHWSLAWVDTVICAVFIFDFGLRFQAAPDRRHYFRRHWFTDLLPAIPFGIITLSLGAFSAAQHTSAVRALRLPALVARNSRPVVRLLRIVLFLLRGMDRMVRHYSWLLNRDIVFFTPAPPRDLRTELLQRTDTLRHRLRQHINEMTATSGEHGHDLLRKDIAYTEHRLTLLSHWQPYTPLSRRQTVMQRTTNHQRAIRVEEVIDSLTNTDEEAIEITLGAEFPRQVANLSRVAVLPPLRWLPVFGEAARAKRRARTHLEQATRFAHQLGYRLQRLNDRLLMFADLHGIITPAQLVDRAGGLLVNAMQRPAKRFLFMGILFTILTLLVEITRIPWLDATAGWLREHLGLPIILLGSIAFAMVQLGNWFQRVAATANAASIRAAQAQFLDLLNQTKKRRHDIDYALLKERVLDPEVRIGGTQPPSLPTCTDFITAARHSFVHHQANAIGLADRIALLYQDYMASAPLHANSRTSTRQLLGNFTLKDLTQRVMRFTKREQKQLHALRLDRVGGLQSPGLWFNFITQAVAQRVGALIEDYNRNVLPLTERQSLPEAHPRQQQFNRWLKRKQGLTLARNETGPINLGYATTAFTSLDFLTVDDNRIANLDAQFGGDIVRRIHADRKRLIREIFGTLPFYNRPSTERSINLYRLYWNFLGNSRLFWLPFTLSGVAIRGIGWLSKAFYRTLKQLLDPEYQPPILPEEAFADFSVALRKLLRMRKPVFLAACRLRARIDIEYLGLALPGRKTSTVNNGIISSDLSSVQASLMERDPFHELAATQFELVEKLSRYLTEHGLLGLALHRYLQQHQPHLANQPLRALRAITMAHAVNFDDLADHIHAELELPKTIQQAIGQRGYPTSGRRWLWRLLQPLRDRSHQLRLRLDRGYRRDWAHFQAWWSNQQDTWITQTGIAGPQLVGYLTRWWQNQPTGFRRFVSLASIAPACGLEERIHETIDNVLSGENIWSEQLLTLRTVQTLTVMDFALEKELIWVLGDYANGKPSAPPAR